MSISCFDLFSIGIGPSSSHTVGPMLAALDFAQTQLANNLKQCKRIHCELYGSLALTGKGHATDVALINGLAGEHPETVDPNSMLPRMQAIITEKQLTLNQQYSIEFDVERDLIFNQKEFLPKHSNGMRFTAFAADDQILVEQIYYSIGGGFIVTDEQFGQEKTDSPHIPYPFSSAKELLSLCEREQLSISELMLANERSWRSEEDIYARIQQLCQIMQDCIKAGCHTSGYLPGVLRVKRRAAELYNKLQNRSGICSIYEDADIMNRLNVYAMAVNEENAAGGRIITAPTNGAAGIIPAVMQYYRNYHKSATDEGLINFFLTASAIGILYKTGASISGAEVGCQGEVGVASSMAAAGLTAALGGDIHQIENAAEIAMEHHLGMTCDPIAGLVQIPCIERNAMGAVKAVNAARMALMSDGTHYVSLDNVIKTMHETGRDMLSKYKETSQGGLAVNLPEC